MITSAFDEFVLWGSAGHAKVLAEIIALRGGRVVALFDHRDVPSALPGIPVYVGAEGFDRWAASRYDLGRIAGGAAIGGQRGLDRIAIQRRFLAKGLSVPQVIHPMAFVSGTACLGRGTQVFALAAVASGASLGEACIVNHKASIDHECVLGDGVHIAPGATLCGCVVVADNVLIGAGSVVLPRLSIGANAVIGAGAVVTRDVAAGATVVGNPARQI